MMARAKKAVKKEVVVKKNPAVFTDEEAKSFYETLVQELKWQLKDSVTDEEIETMAKSVINKDEETTLWLRRKGVWQMTKRLIQERNEAIAS